MAFPIRCDPSSANDLAMSVGSLAHPELCHKPCLFLKYGSCPKGSACSYCHFQHKCTRLSKRRRLDLEHLGKANTLALILPHLLAKKVPGAEEVISLLEQHLASMPQVADFASVNFKHLNRSLKSLKFRQLVDLCKCRELHGLQEAILSLQANLALRNPAVFVQRFSM